VRFFQVIELTGLLSFLFIANSLITITLIFNQNDSVKDVTTQSSGSSTNPLEKFTWFCFIFQLILLLLKTKLTDF
jgi:hypothetical protein